MGLLRVHLALLRCHCRLLRRARRRHGGRGCVPGGRKYLRRHDRGHHGLGSSTQFALRACGVVGTAVHGAAQLEVLRGREGVGKIFLVHITLRNHRCVAARVVVRHAHVGVVVKVRGERRYRDEG